MDTQYRLPVSTAALAVLGIALIALGIAYWKLRPMHSFFGEYVQGPAATIDAKLDLLNAMEPAAPTTTSEETDAMRAERLELIRALMEEQQQREAEQRAVVMPSAPTEVIKVKPEVQSAETKRRLDLLKTM